MMDRLWRRLFSLLRRQRVTSSAAGNPEQSLTVQDSAGDDTIEHAEAYGFTARPLPGAECITVEIGASSDQPVAIVVSDRRYRRTGLSAGDVSVYREGGQHMTLTTEKIRIVCRYLEVVSSDGVSVSALNGVVHGTAIDPYTGQTYASIGATTDKLRVEA